MEFNKVKDEFINLHENAYDEIKDDIPELDLIEIFQLIKGIALKEMTVLETAKFMAEKYQESIETYLNLFANFAIQDALNYVDNENINKLANDEFSNKIVDVVKELGNLIYKYKKNVINKEKFIDVLSKLNTKPIFNDFLVAMEIDPTMIAMLSELGFEGNVFIICITGLEQVYDEILKVKEEERIAHERRLQIEEECNQAIRIIKEYRKEFNDFINKYITDHIETINKGFELMDQAVIDNDINGYIQGNVEIQKMLGFHVQFTNEDEFNDLMNSDISFKL